MTSAEQQKVLEAIARNNVGVEMMGMDAICYGGDCAKWGEAERYITTIIKSFPKDVIDGFNASIRRAEADKLRAKANAIEKGTYKSTGPAQ